MGFHWKVDNCVRGVHDLFAGLKQPSSEFIVLGSTNLRLVDTQLHTKQTVFFEGRPTKRRISAYRRQVDRYGPFSILKVSYNLLIFHFQPVRLWLVPQRFDPSRNSNAFKRGEHVG